MKNVLVKEKKQDEEMLAQNVIVTFGSEKESFKLSGWLREKKNRRELFPLAPLRI